MIKRLIASLVCLTFSFINLQYVQAKSFSVNQLPVPGTMVGESAPFAPLVLKGLIVNPQKPLEFQFIVDTGKGPQDAASVKDQVNLLAKYFLAGLTIPEGDLWVNLSPYEKNRMVPEALGQTDLGRDLLAQDYILKQLTASLIYPEKALGKEFWSRVYAKAQKQFGTTNVPVDTFNKVWILPDQAQVYENVNAAYVTKSTLKVMLDEDYLALSHHVTSAKAGIQNKNNINALGSQIVRQLILPEIEKEVNTGKNFAPLRQIYQALILAKWYKETIQNGLLDAVYTNKDKIAGVNVNDPKVKEEIYERYLKAYKKGAFNYIKETPTPDGQVMPRKYFSGGTLMVIPLNTNGSEQDVDSQQPDGAMIVVTIGLIVAGGALGRALYRGFDFRKGKEGYEYPPFNQGKVIGQRIGNYVWNYRYDNHGNQVWYEDYPAIGWIYEPKGTKDAAMISLAKMKIAFWARIGNVDKITAMLKDGDYNVRSSAAKALGQLGDERAVDPLLGMLKDEDYNVRSSAAKALGQLGASKDQMVNGYIAALSSQDNDARENAVIHLGQLRDKRAVDPLLGILKDGDGAVRFLAAEALGQLGDKRAVDPLLGMLKDEDYDVRFYAEESLAKLEASKEQLVNGHIAALSSQFDGARNNAAKQLGQLGDKRAVDPLLGMLKDRSWGVRSSAAKALGQLGDKRAVAPLLGMLKGRNNNVRSAAEEALGQLGDKRAVAPLLGMLKGRNNNVRSAAEEALGQLGDERTVDPLLGMLKDRYDNVRSSAEKALAQLGASKEQLVNGYIAALSSQDNEVRENAVIHLGQLGDKRAVDPLLGMLKDGYFPVYSSAEKALAKLGASKDQMVNGHIAALSSGGKGARYKAAGALYRIHPLDKAMTGLGNDVLITQKAKDLGGIDLNQINVKRNGNAVNVQFDQAQLNALEQGGFEGFTPVIINVTRISSPFQLLGINTAKEPEQLAKV